MRKVGALFLVLFLVLLVCSVSAGGIGEDIIEAFDSGEQNVEVIIELKDVSPPRGTLQSNGDLVSLENVIDEEKVEYAFENSIAAEISGRDLNVLIKNTNVKSVVKMGRIYALLQDSVGIINASPTWILKSSGVNLTGVGQSVCVIDSGINYSHPDLSGNYLGGYDYVDSDDDPMDGFGHGTHVAGIVAASGGITGISPSVGIVAIRVLDNLGSGSPADLASAINWCVNNASQFNISVISMSLGCNASLDGYSSYCDSIVDGCFNLAIASAINSAVLNNISVVAASGNYGSTEKISSPACIQNTIAVSSVSKAGLFSPYDRNSLVNLLAPGEGINSTCLLGNIGYLNGYCSKSGTSMATPMVSGAIALINQYLNLSGQRMTPGEIEETLNNTGLRVNDSGGSNINYSIIDSYAAMLSLDTTAPNVTLISPTDGLINTSVNHTFSCNATDWQLANLTLKLWNSSGLYYNETVNISGIENSSDFNLTDMPTGDYSWNCLGIDVLGNSNYSSANFSLTVGGVSTSLISPVNGTNINSNEINFSCNFSSEESYALDNVTFYLWNLTGLLYNETTDLSGLTNSSTFNYTFSDETSYLWNCEGVNNNSNSSLASSNYSFVYDATIPIVTLFDVADSTSTSRDFIFNVSDSNSIANCTVYVDGTETINTTAINKSFNNTISVSGLLVATQEAYANCTDAGGNVGNSSTISFIVEETPVTTDDGGGGSGGADTVISLADGVYNATSTEVSAGYTQTLQKNDKVNFNIFDAAGGRHLLTMNAVGIDHVNLTIESDPINLTLGIGQSAKLNLTSPVYYDLLVKLNNIVNGKAELMIQLINEPIEEKIVEVEGEDKIVETEVILIKDYFWVIVALVVVLVIAVITFIIRGKRKKLKGKKPKKDRKKKGSRKKNGKDKNEETEA
jgi:subtilisin family serine protease